MKKLTLSLLFISISQAYGSDQKLSAAEQYNLALRRHAYPTTIDYLRRRDEGRAAKAIQVSKAKQVAQEDKINKEIRDSQRRCIRDNVCLAVGGAVSIALINCALTYALTSLK